MALLDGSWVLVLMLHRFSLFFGNTIYLVAIGYYFLISFLGYNGKPSAPPTRLLILTPTLALPFLHHTELLLTPIVVCGILWFISLFGFNIPQAVSPIFAIGAGHRPA
jgi:hypothetical protein